LDATGDGLTQRERLEDAKSQSPICAACHAQVDALGYAFEQYDQLGRWREVDNGRPIDASGNVELGGVQVPFSGARELSRLIADSAEGKTCFVNHWLEAALRRPASEADALLLSAMGQSFADHQERAAELLVAVTQIGNLRYRLASEVAP